MRKILYTALVLSVILPMSACSFSNYERAKTTMKLTSDHIAGSSIEVRSRNGRIEVVAVPTRTDIAIEATLYALGDTMAEAQERLAATTVEVSRTDDGTLLIEPKFPEPVRGGDGASLMIEVPDAHGATLDTSNGSVYTYGLTGQLVVDTSNGSVEVVDHDGEARLRSSNGRITVDDHHGSLEADTSNGSIVLTLEDDQRGPIDLNTSNGSITVRVGTGFAGTVALKTSNGTLTVRDHLGRITNQSINKYSGRIVVGEGGEPSRVSTSNGRIRFTISG